MKSLQDQFKVSNERIKELHDLVNSLLARDPKISSAAKDIFHNDTLTEDEKIIVLLGLGVEISQKIPKSYVAS